MPQSLSVGSPGGKRRAPRVDDPRTEPRAVRIAIIALAVAFLGLFIVLPLVDVFAQAFAKGVERLSRGARPIRTRSRRSS